MSLRGAESLAAPGRSSRAPELQEDNYRASRAKPGRAGRRRLLIGLKAASILPDSESHLSTRSSLSDSSVTAGAERDRNKEREARPVPESVRKEGAR
ncbi:hypothetical protein NQZ68_025447 [Dissostichus eleginoides]|nr:hypothetical protein NQZ68_025447 [Dissostichus eleginoides]